MQREGVDKGNFPWRKRDKSLNPAGKRRKSPGGNPFIRENKRKIALLRRQNRLVWWEIEESIFVENVHFNFIGEVVL